MLDHGVGKTTSREEGPTDSLETLLSEVIGPFVSPAWGNGIRRVTVRYALSEREAEVMALLLYGRSVERIGALLFVSPYTVKCHRHNLYSKLGVHSLQELLDLLERVCRESMGVECDVETPLGCHRPCVRREVIRLVIRTDGDSLKKVVKQ